METACRSAAASVSSNYFSSPSPGPSFRFAFKDPRWSDKELRVIVRSEFPERAAARDEDEDTEKAGAKESGSPVSRSNSNDSLSGNELDVEIIKVPVNSVILAKESAYFRTLFGGNGFRESNTYSIDIIISPPEKSTFQHLIECMYTTKVTLSKVEDLIALWGLSERFLVKSCSQLCTQKLKDMHLDLSQSIRILEAVHLSNPSGELRSLVEASTQFLTRHFKNMSFVKAVHSRESDKELLRDFTSLPQSALQAVLGSDDLQVEREEIAYYAVVLWVKENTFTGIESQEMMTQLAPLIRFPFMKADVLSGLLEYPELAGALCQELVVEGLKFRTATDEMKQKTRSDVVKHRRFERRRGYLKPINCLVLEQPKKQAIIHFNISLEELESLEPSVPLIYESFRVAGSSFAFQIHEVLTSSNKKKVGLDLRMCTTTVGRVQVELNVSIWSLPLMAFFHRFHAKHMFQVENLMLRCVDLFGKELKEVLTEKGQWACEGKIFFNAELSIRS